ncbi:MAG: hypothetical protein HFG39_07870 [Lachnospiraceae bacterium]|nr:hypothetical protein [Lachnospiraceae bacterium]
MKIKIRDFLKKYLGLTIIISAIVGAIISWGFNWILPSPNMTASNIPKKELTCTLDYSFPMIARKSIDNKLQLLYDGKSVNDPYVYSITITNTGVYAITNEDFKDTFFVNFLGSHQVVNAQIVKSSNGAILDEVVSNAKLDGTKLLITDFYLNTGESFGIYLIVDGKPNVISYHSRISGISELTLRNTPKEKRDTFVHHINLFAIVFILILIIFLIWIRWKAVKFDEKYEKLLQEMKKNV